MPQQIPVQWIIRLRRHEQATDAAEHVPHGDTGGVAVAKHAVADPTTAVDVAVVDLDRVRGRVYRREEEMHGEEEAVERV